MTKTSGMGQVNEKSWIRRNYENFNP